MDKKSEIKSYLGSSKLIADSTYTVEQWEAILEVLPEKYLDELYGFLLLENKKRGKDS